jgi:hypothetical protein
MMAEEPMSASSNQHEEEAPAADPVVAPVASPPTHMLAPAAVQIFADGLVFGGWSSAGTVKLHFFSDLIVPPISEDSPGGTAVRQITTILVLPIGSLPDVVSKLQQTLELISDKGFLEKDEPAASDALDEQ